MCGARSVSTVCKARRGPLCVPASCDGLKCSIPRLFAQCHTRAALIPVLNSSGHASHRVSAKPLRPPAAASGASSPSTSSWSYPHLRARCSSRMARSSPLTPQWMTRSGGGAVSEACRAGMSPRADEYLTGRRDVERWIGRAVGPGPLFAAATDCAPGKDGGADRTVPSRGRTVSHEALTV